MTGDLEALLAGAPFTVRPGTPIVVDRHGESAFIVCEPANQFPTRVRKAEAWCAMANAEADRRRTPLNQAAE